MTKLKKFLKKFKICKAHTYKVSRDITKNSRELKCKICSKEFIQDGFFSISPLSKQLKAENDLFLDIIAAKKLEIKQLEIKQAKSADYYGAPPPLKKQPVPMGTTSL